MRHDVVVNFPLTFKTNMIFDRIRALPYFIHLLFDDGKAKLAFGFRQCDPEVAPSAEFAIVESGEHHLFAGVAIVEAGLVGDVWSM
jgi:hypothetical protein